MGVDAPSASSLEGSPVIILLDDEDNEILAATTSGSPLSPSHSALSSSRCRWRRWGAKGVAIVSVISVFSKFYFWNDDNALTAQAAGTKTFKFDINGPPVPLPDKQTLDSLLEIKLQEKERQTTETNVAHNNYPVLHADDQTIPGAVGLHASEALLCRQSVINFVINATDGKDECEGLKKAFDKTCSNDDSQHSSATTTGRGKRHLMRDKTQHFTRMQLFVYQHYRWIHRWLNKFTYGSPLFFFAEDEVASAYKDSQCLIDYDLDGSIFPELQKEWLKQRIMLQQEQRRLEEEKEMTTTDKTVDKIPLKSLSLPTSSEHVSDKVLSETLLLQQGDKVIEMAQNESKKNEEAVKDAKASSQAVADTNAAVSALLNDPSSVEARTCCASILNVYHENCSTDDQENYSDSKLFFVVIVIAMCGMVKSLIRHYRIVWLPEAAGCILVGGTWRKCLNAVTLIDLTSIFLSAVLSGYILVFFPHHDISFDGNWFLRIMVPPIVFEAALNIDKRAFSRHVVPIAIYSVVGTLMATAITAFVVHRGTVLLRAVCEPIPTVEALTFGALISSIDPIAVLSVLSNMGMTDTDTIYVVIFGESLLNDGVAIVLFHTLVHFLDENLVIDGDAMTAASVHFLVVAIGSLLIGMASGMLSTVYYWLFHGCQTPLVEVLMFVCWALLPYYVCDGIGWSGIVACVATGFIMDLYIVGGKHEEAIGEDSEDSFLNGSRNGVEPRRLEYTRRRIFSPQGHLSDEARQHIGFVTEIISTSMETGIFAYLGLFLFSHRYHWNVAHSFIAILACCASRAIMIPSLSLIANWITRLQQKRIACRAQGRKNAQSALPGVVIDHKMQTVLWFAGLRGAMSFALVENIPLYDSVSGEGTRLKPELKAMTSASIMFTVFILGGYTYYVMDYLGMVAPRKSQNPSYEMTSLISKTDSGDQLDVSDSSKNESVKKWNQKRAFRRSRQAVSDDDIQVQ